MGLISKVWGAVKKTARSVVNAVGALGRAAAKVVTKTWQKTKATVKAAASWVARRVEQVATWISNLTRSTFEWVKEFLGLDEEAPLDETIAQLQDMLANIVSLAKEVTESDNLTNFLAYLEATAALHVAQHFLSSLNEDNVSEAALTAIRALHDLIAEGECDEHGLRALDEFCRDQITLPQDMEVKGFLDLGAAHVQMAWNSEGRTLEDDNIKASLLCTELELKATMAEENNNTKQAKTLRNALKREESGIADNKKRVQDLHLAVNVLEGVMTVQAGQEDDRTLVRDADEVSRLLAKIVRADSQFSGEDREFLESFADCYRARAYLRTKATDGSLKVDKDDVSVEDGLVDV